MLNPDGVINGNYRCNLAGFDLNRKWDNPTRDLHPTIFHFKKLILQFHKKHSIDFICDLHGHSRKMNIFMYGNEVPGDQLACKIFPYMMSRISPIFSYDSCNFGIQKAKMTTMRVQLFKKLGNPNTFTLESSFCGASCGSASGKHFDSSMLKTVG